jgi:6-phosphogluconolactonase (cycloisomerase 2 family)
LDVIFFFHSSRKSSKLALTHFFQTSQKEPKDFEFMKKKAGYLYIIYKGEKAEGRKG